MSSFTLKSIYILAATALINLHPVMASETRHDGIDTRLLAPAVPAVADFYDADSAPDAGINLSLLAPVTPRIAEFGDEPATDSSQTINKIAPVTPKEADFER